MKPETFISIFFLAGAAISLTASPIGRMRNRIQTLADELLERAMSTGELDVIKDYALPLPMTIITEILGVPARANGRSASEYCDRISTLASQHSFART